MTFELPFPVPFHALWIKHRGGGGVPSKRYAAYGRHASQMMLAQRVKPVNGKVQINIEVVAPDKRRRDGDNLWKCINDVLVKNGVIEDDSNRVIVRQSLEWVKSGPPCRITIESWAEI